MRVLITAGPTREPLDAVRYLSNRSSGTLGLALAHAAADAGHDTTLLLGPVQQPANLPDAVHRHGFETVDELRSLLAEQFLRHDVLIMAAAVGDYRLEGTLPPKAERKDTLTLTLTATPDLVAGVASTKRKDQAVIAFALEDRDQLEQRAVEKLKRKHVDAIVANPLTTMDAGDIDAVLFTADGQREQPGRMSKTDFATWLIALLPELPPH